MTTHGDHPVHAAVGTFVRAQVSVSEADILQSAYVQVQLSPPTHLCQLFQCRGCGCIISLCKVQTLHCSALCYWVS
jgi:hypothetical protein